MLHRRMLEVTAAAVTIATGLSVPAPAQKTPPLRVIARIDLPGPVGKRFDYLTMDYPDNYLLSAHLGAGILYVIDVRSNQLVRAIPEVAGIEGVVYAPDLHRAYTSDWFENKIGVVDLRAMKVIAKLPTESKPDGSAYAAPFHKVYVSDERGKAEAVVDVRSNTITKALHFDSETGMPQYDEVSRQVLLNLQDTNRLAVIDPASDAVVAQYAVGKCRGNHGMALDTEHRRAFLSCEGNDLLTVFDLDKHVPVAYLPMAPDPDVVKFDPGLRRIYVACYSGAISIFEEDDPDHFHKVEDFPVQPRVHSLAVDVRTHRVYAPEQEEDGKPVARMIVYAATP